MSDPNVGWHADTRCYIIEDPTNFDNREKPRRLIGAWMDANFTHTWGQSATSRDVDFTLIRREKNRRKYLLIYPRDEAAELWLLMNAPSYH